MTVPVTGVARAITSMPMVWVAWTVCWPGESSPGPSVIEFTPTVLPSTVFPLRSAPLKVESITMPGPPLPLVVLNSTVLL